MAETSAGVAQVAGTSARIVGSIELLGEHVQGHGNGHRPSATLADIFAEEGVQVRAYFPDSLTEVTPQLGLIPVSGSELRFRFDTPFLPSAGAHTLIIEISDLPPDSTRKTLRLAYLQFPLQVGNQVAAPQISGTAQGRFWVEIESRPGSAIEGEMTDITTRITNLRQAHGSPSIGEENDDQWLAEYRWNGSIVRTEGPVAIPNGGTLSYTYTTPRLQSGDPNDFKATLFAWDEEDLGPGKKFASLTLREPVAIVSVSSLPPNPFPSDGREGAFAPAADTALAPGVHHFTTITIPAGVVVRAGGSAMLELRATGDVTVHGTIDLAGALGVERVATFGYLFQGGPGGNTGDPLTNGMPATLAGCPLAAGGGIGTAGQDGITIQGPGQPILASTCATPGGSYGGGAGGNGCGSGAGAGGVAGGGGGGANYFAYGGNGGGPYGGLGGAPGTVAGDPQPGEGGSGPGSYAGLTAVWHGCGRGVTWSGNGGGGGSIGPGAAADLAVLTTFYPGSGGGGGGGDCNYLNGGGGGGGAGGAVRIASPTSIKITGSVLANGGRGGDAFENAGPGGGGSGGVIHLLAPNLDVSGTVTARGGAAGCTPIGALPGGGGSGGLGRIRIETQEANCALSGFFDPPLQSGCSNAAAPGYTSVDSAR